MALLINQLTICFKNVVKALDIYSQKNDKFVLCSDLNSEHTESSLSETLLKYDWKNLVMEKTCFKNSKNPRCIDLFLTNCVKSFQNINCPENVISKICS